MCDFQYPLSYEPILALLLYTDFHVVIFKLKILAIAPPPLFLRPCSHLLDDRFISASSLFLDLSLTFCLLHLQISSRGRADSVMDSHTTGPGFKTRWVQCTFYRASD